MAVCVVMPKSGITVETCVMGSWEKKIGDKVEIGEKLFSYETDKSSFDCCAETAGFLLAILAEEGDDVPALSPVCYIGEMGEKIPDVAATKYNSETETPGEPEKIDKTDKDSVHEADIISEKKEVEINKVRISPRARKLADKMGMEGYEAIDGTGPNGRIIERDIRTWAKEFQRSAKAVSPLVKTAGLPSTESEYTDETLTNIRKVIAKNMHSSLSEMAQLTHFKAFDASELLQYRSRIKANAEKMNIPNITLNDFILFGVSRILLKYPDVNAHFLGDKIRHFHHVHLGMAVDTPRGLMVPTIFEADTKSLVEISIEAKELAAACQSGSITPDKLTGASFTVSNIGAFGTEMFTPVINPPQTAILGVGAMVDRVRRKDGEIELYPALGLSLTYDHRAMDGAPASRFLQNLCEELEHFTVMLAL